MTKRTVSPVNPLSKLPITPEVASSYPDTSVVQSYLGFVETGQFYTKVPLELLIEDASPLGLAEAVSIKKTGTQQQVLQAVAAFGVGSVRFNSELSSMRLPDELTVGDLVKSIVDKRVASSLPLPMHHCGYDENGIPISDGHMSGGLFIAASFASVVDNRSQREWTTRPIAIGTKRVAHDLLDHYAGIHSYSPYLPEYMFTLAALSKARAALPSRFSQMSPVSVSGVTDGRSALDVGMISQLIESLDGDKISEFPE